MVWSRFNSPKKQPRDGIEEGIKTDGEFNSWETTNRRNLFHKLRQLVKNNELFDVLHYVNKIDMYK